GGVVATGQGVPGVVRVDLVGPGGVVGGVGGGVGGGVLGGIGGRAVGGFPSRGARTLVPAGRRGPAARCDGTPHGDGDGERAGGHGGPGPRGQRDGRREIRDTARRGRRGGRGGHRVADDGEGADHDEHARGR